MEEIWKDVVGWEGLYKVSNFGRVKSLPRMHNAIHPYITKEIILRPRVCGKDREYLSVSLNNNGYTKQRRIHILVAEAFIPNPNGYTEINHKDEVKGNNRVDNLEWCSRSYNVNYGNGKQKRRLHCIKKVAQYDLFGNLICIYDSYVDAANAVGGYSASICHAVKGRIKTHKGFVWKNI